MDTNVRRGDIYYADLSPVVGSEQGGVRPVLIVQNDTGNRHSPTVIAAAIQTDRHLHGPRPLPHEKQVCAMVCTDLFCLCVFPRGAATPGGCR